MCVSCYISKKIRVGRSLLIFIFFKFLFFYFPRFYQETQQMCCLHDLYNEKVSFWGYLLTIQNACPTVKALNESQSKQVFKQQYSFKYDSESGKTNKKWPQTG